jgi:ATP-dependent RNA helicase RhlE
MAFIIKPKAEGSPSVEPVEPKSKPQKGPSVPPGAVVIPAEAAIPSDEPTSSDSKLEDPALQIEWSSLSLQSDLIELLISAGLARPTPVQAKAIPEALQNFDLIVSAQTGTGKTAAFVLPIIEKLRGRKGTYCVVLCPTREIALQTEKVFQQFGKPFGIECISLIGGTPLKTDEALLQTYPQVIIATPGRMCDHIERGTVWLDYLEILVLDEADRMLDMGFSVQLNQVLDQTPNTRQTLLFSATLSPKIEKLAHSILYQPKRIQVGKTSRTASTIEQRFVFLEEEQKFPELEHLLYEVPGSTFVFTRSKDSAAKLWRKLRNRGFHEATQLHSNLAQEVREEALEDFKSGKYRVMIATDVMGRGIHVDEVSHVINYDFPREAEDYVHRIGRTGRAESSGISTSLVTRMDHLVVRDVEKIIGKKVLPSNTSHERSGPPSKNTKSRAPSKHPSSRKPKPSGRKPA